MHVSRVRSCQPRHLLHLRAVAATVRTLRPPVRCTCRDAKWLERAMGRMPTGAPGGLLVVSGNLLHGAAKQKTCPFVICVR